MLAYYCEWIGCIFGLTGAFLLASNTRFSRYGWIAFSIANIALLIFAIELDRPRLVLTYTGFTISSTVGLYRAGFFRFLVPMVPGPQVLKQSAASLQPKPFRVLFRVTLNHRLDDRSELRNGK